MVGSLKFPDSTAAVGPGPARVADGDSAGPTVPEAASRQFIVSSIRRHARSRPDALAVVDPDCSLTYRQLLDQAAALAAGIAAAAPRTDDVVAVWLPRGSGQVTAAVAAMLAGRPYLLVDTEQPSLRAGHLLKDSAACVLLTLERLADDLSEADTPLLLVDGRPAAPDDFAGATEQGGGSELAYLCYTSGSTGLPKGVQVTHHGLANMVAWYTWHYRVAPDDRMTQLASPAFDAWAMEVWPCLTAGAVLHVAEPTVTRSPDRLRDWLLANAITVCFVPTPLAVELLASPWPRSAAGGSALRAMLVGGDRLARPPAERPPFRLYNNYGPTECTVVATCGEVVDFGSAGPPPIGRPIPSVDAFVLRPDGSPCPDGVPGELHLGGPAVARGYVGDPEATARSFLTDPRSEGPTGRRYRTGDLVRRDADGDLHYLGRGDDQLKVNGVRIEPGEVEGVLLRHPAVREAAVVLHRSPDGADHLVGYVVTGGEFDERSLRGYTAEHLPKLMIPHLFLALDALPLTLNGKLDRAELAHRPLPGGDAGEPAGTTQAELRALWVEVLRVADVESTDDFFDLGGDSLRVMRLISKARRVGLVLVPEDLFRHPVLSDLARSLDHGHATEGSEDVAH